MISCKDDPVSYTHLDVYKRQMHGNLGPNINTNKCDVLIAVVMRFDDLVTGNLATFAKQAKVIHFDIDPAEVNKNVKVDVCLLYTSSVPPMVSPSPFTLYIRSAISFAFSGSGQRTSLVSIRSKL